MNSFKKFLKENWLLVFAFIYLIVPVDLLPDLLPIVGRLDDSSLLLVDVIRRYIDFKKNNEKN